MKRQARYLVLSARRSAIMALGFQYDAAGQLIQATDHTLGQITRYSYDAGGRRIRESMVQAGVTYQDNHIAYDALGRMRWVADTRSFINIDYDKVGNRTHIRTHVLDGSVGQDTDRWFQYDAMNRQTVVDAVDANGTIVNGQGHILTYDKNGNRTSDTSIGRRVVGTQVLDHYNQVSTGVPVYQTDESGAPLLDEDGHPIPLLDEWGQIVYQTESVPVYRTDYAAGTGQTTEAYTYDGLKRLATVVRDGTTLDTRLYDKASRVVQSGPAGTLPEAYVNALNGTNWQGQTLAGNGTETQLNRYNLGGQMMEQIVFKSDGTPHYKVNYEPVTPLFGNFYPGLGFVQPGTNAMSGYDAAGNLVGYTLTNFEGKDTTSHYSIVSAALCSCARLLTITAHWRRASTRPV